MQDNPVKFILTVENIDICNFDELDVQLILLNGGRSFLNQTW